jgi:hypothetical protein
MAAGTVDEKRIEAAVRRLPVLPERKGELNRAVTGLLYVVQRIASKDDAEPPPERPIQDSVREVDVERLSWAKELRETQWLIHDFKEAWADLSVPARDALNRRLRAAGTSEAEPDDLIDRLAQVAESMAAAADDLEQPDRPVPAAAAPKAEDPPMLIAQHAARMYTRLTGKKPPKPKGKDGTPRGPFYWLLEDVFAAAGILASADHYATIVAQG